MGKEPKKIVILGAGFGGLAVVQSLNSLRHHRAYAVTVIDRSSVHQYTPLFYEVATAFVEHKNLGTTQLLRQGITVDNASVLSGYGADFIRADITDIDWKAREVITGDSRIPFDFLVIAVGSEVAYFDIPGMEEHALILKSVRDADRLRQRVHDLLHKREKGRISSLDIVVGGAGATGVEFATELTMFLRKHLVKGHLGPQDFSISLIEARNRVLGILDPALSIVAQNRLQALGVAVHLDTMITSVTPGVVSVCPRKLAEGEDEKALKCRIKGGGDIPADLVVWTGGVRGNRLLEKLGIPLEGRGSTVRVDETLRVPGKEDVFIIGDVADLRHPISGEPVPWQATAAMRHGKIVARSIVRAEVSGRVPDSTSLYRREPIIVTLGGKYAVAQVGRFKFVGLTGWLLRKAADLRYFTHILGLMRGISLWWHGVKVYSRND